MAWFGSKLVVANESFHVRPTSVSQGMIRSLYPSPGFIPTLQSVSQTRIRTSVLLNRRVYKQMMGTWHQQSLQKSH